MREIKFRAWDEKKEVMHLDFQFVRSGTEGNDWILFKSDKEDNIISHPQNPYFSQQLKIMRFTGLKDKNKDDIYEGDILFCERSYGYMPSRGYLKKGQPKVISGYLVVEYKFGHFTFRFKNPIKEHKEVHNNNKQTYAYVYYSLDEHSTVQNHVEIIGNIYEQKLLNLNTSQSTPYTKDTQ